MQAPNQSDRNHPHHSDNQTAYDNNSYTEDAYANNKNEEKFVNVDINNNSVAIPVKDPDHPNRLQHPCHPQLNANNQKIRCKRKTLANRGYVKRMRLVPFLGISFAILYAFFMSSSVSMLRVVPSLHPISVLFYRSIIQLVTFAILALWNGNSLLGIPNERWPVFGRATTGFANQACWYVSIRYISLTDSSAIYYSAPVFVTILAVFMLKEPFGAFETISVLVTVVGVTLISKPGFLPFFAHQNTQNTIPVAISNPFNSLNATASKVTDNVIRNITSIVASNSTLYGNNNSTMTPNMMKSIGPNTTTIISNNASHVLNTINNSITGNMSVTAPLVHPISDDNDHVTGMILALGGCITFALSNIYLRKLQKTSTEVTAFWFSVFTMIATMPLMCYLDVFKLPQTKIEIIITLAVGIFSTLGQIAFTLAMKIEKAGPVAVAQTLNIVIVLFYQIMFFHEPVTTTSAIGVVLIMFSVAVVGLKDLILASSAFRFLKSCTTGKTESWKVESKDKITSQDTKWPMQRAQMKDVGVNPAFKYSDEQLYTCDCMRKQEKSKQTTLAPSAADDGNCTKN